MLSSGMENLFGEPPSEQCAFTGGDGVVGEIVFGGGVCDCFKILSFSPDGFF